MKYKYSENYQKKEQIAHTFIDDGNKDIVLIQCTEYKNRFWHNGTHARVLFGKTQFNTLGKVDGWVTLSEMQRIDTMITIITDLLNNENFIH